MDEQNTQNHKEEEVNVAQSQTATSTKAAGGGKKTPILIALVAVLVAGGIYYAMTNSVAGPQTADSDMQTGTNGPFVTPEYPDVVAVVNGEEVTGDDYAVGVSQIAQTAMVQGVDPSQPEVLAQVEAEAYDVLINTIVLRQAAEASGVTVTDEDVDAEFTRIEVQYGGAEAFAETLGELGITTDDVKDDVRAEMMISAYLDANSDMAAVTVTEAEVEEMYNTLTEGAEEAPTLEEIYTPIEEQLLAEKQQEVISSIIDELRANAEIEERL